MLKTRTWIIILAAAFLLCGAACLWIFLRPVSGQTANIYRNGVCIYSVDLSRVSESYEMTFTDDSGSNTVSIERGRICVSEADCPDQVCVESGWLSDSTVPIVCLPHRLVIRIEDQAADTGSDTGIDAVAS